MRPHARQDLTTVAPELWAIAKARERVLRPLVRDGRKPETAAIAEAAGQLGLSVQWVRRLLKRLADDPRTSTLLPDGGGRPHGSTVLNASAENVIAHCIRTHYATPQRPPFRALLDAVSEECRCRGLAVPVPRTISRRLRAVDPTALLARREGHKMARARLGPAGKHFEPASRPLQLVQIDHTLADLIVVDEIYRAPIGRPWLTLAIDVFSRMVVGYYVTLEAPSSLSVALCLAHVVSDKAPWLVRLGVQATWPSGLPEAVHLDNAAEFHAAALVRGCEEHGMIITYRPVATPHYGGHVERLVGTMMGEVHLLPGTTFSNVLERGSYDSEGQATMTLAEFDAWLARQIALLVAEALTLGIFENEPNQWDRLRITWLVECWRQSAAGNRSLARAIRDAIPSNSGKHSSKHPFSGMSVGLDGRNQPLAALCQTCADHPFRESRSKSVPSG